MRTNRRKRSQDALRWLMGVLVTAVIASAVTSAVFMAARPEPAPVDPMEERLRASRQLLQSLEAELKSTATAHLDEENAAHAHQPQVEAVYRTALPPEGEEFPMVAPDDKMLMRAAAASWHLEVRTSNGRRKLVRVVDIRESPSLTRPGYIGVVEVTVETSRRRLATSGDLPFEAPQGFQVITAAEYTELEEGRQYNVRPASLKSNERLFSFERWAPATPPPAELPEAVRRQFNRAIVDCSAGAPTVRVSKERLMFFYSLRERKWTPQS